MVHVVKSKLYKVITKYGVPQYVESDNKEDLFNYIISDWLFKGIDVGEVIEIRYDGNNLGISLDDSFKRILTDKLNKQKGKAEITAKEQELLRKQYL